MENCDMDHADDGRITWTFGKSQTHSTERECIDGIEIKIRNEFDGVLAAASTQTDRECAIRDIRRKTMQLLDEARTTGLVEKTRRLYWHFAHNNPNQVVLYI